MTCKHYVYEYAPASDANILHCELDKRASRCKGNYEFKGTKSNYKRKDKTKT